MISDDVRECLEKCDVTRMRALWHAIAPQLPQPENEFEAAITLHMARTQTDNIAFKYRAYSHAWLTERSLPSQLPDELKPAAERMYPRIVTAVGISVNIRGVGMKPVADQIRGAMEDAVNEAYADGKIDPVFVKERMEEARRRITTKLLG